MEIETKINIEDRVEIETKINIEDIIIRLESIVEPIYVINHTSYDMARVIRNVIEDIKNAR